LGVEVGVGKAVSVGIRVKVEIANVGNGEGSIIGADGGAISDQLQARVAENKASTAKKCLTILPPKGFHRSEF